MNEEMKGMACRCCVNYFSSVGCQISDWGCCKPDYSPSRIKDEAVRKGMTVSDICALLGFFEPDREY